MKVNQTIDIGGSQTLTITPRLRQAIGLLLLSHRELEAFLQEQIVENPLISLENNKPKGEEHLEDFRIVSPYKMTTNTHSGDESFSFESFISNPLSLTEHLLTQASFVLKTEEEREVGEYIIYNLNEHGFLVDSKETIAKDTSKPCSLVEKVINILQKLDPPGVCAKDLTESLLLQMKDKKKLTAEAYEIITSLNKLQSMTIESFSRNLKIKKDKCLEILGEIKTLSLNPCERFIPHNSEIIEPDLFVISDSKKELTISLNQKHLPKIKLDKHYHEFLKNKTLSSKERLYLNTQYTHADWLTKALEQRASSLLKVGKVIVDSQKEFFYKGLNSLKPLSIKNVAEELGVHESTVSRVTTNKFIATPKGTFSLRFFFNSGIKQTSLSKSGITTSSRAIKEKIKTLIGKENLEEPLSDDKIVGLLLGEGLTIARRTVTKYRKSLNIPPSYDRRQNYKIKKIFKIS